MLGEAGWLLPTMKLFAGPASVSPFAAIRVYLGTNRQEVFWYGQVVHVCCDLSISEN